MKTKLHSLILAGAVALAASTHAQTIPVVSYSYGTAPSGSYPDSGGELTDGLATSLAWGAGVSIGYEDVTRLVGWQSYQPNVTFYFDGAVRLGSFTAWFADSEGHAGVYLPTEITLSNDDFSQTFLVTNPVGAGYTVPLTFDGFDVITDRITLSAVNPHNWVMMSEVSFSGTSNVPEPASVASLFGAVAGVWAVVRRRRVQAARARS